MTCTKTRVIYLRLKRVDSVYKRERIFLGLKSGLPIETFNSFKSVSEA